MSRVINKDESSHWSDTNDLYSSMNARGSYSPFHFVVRLHPEIKELLDKGPDGIVTARELGFETSMAFSTYLHETIHWWQHIGSTTGLMLSLAYPAQAHVNHARLLEIIKELGPKKSLKTLADKEYEHLTEMAQSRLNSILNNWHDNEFNRCIVMNPLKIQDIIKSPYFDSIGHSLEIGLEHSLWLLKTTFDSNFSFIPDFRKWEECFDDLRRREWEGYYYGSPCKIMPVGALHIFESQARFSQLQYLYLVTGGSLSWEDFVKMGMMGETYTKAFKTFLTWTNLEWPANPIDPIVQLFLLICDLAVNPSDGYPFDLWHFESFRESVDPSFRFYICSQHIANTPALLSSISKCDRDTYITVSSELSSILVCRPPVEICTRIANWSKNIESLQRLLAEDDAFNFNNENLPVRLFFARHIRFAEERIRRPDFFCWPAMHYSASPIMEPDFEDSMAMWNRHQPLFMAELDGEIRPTLLNGRSQDNISVTFNNYFSWSVHYDLVRQWIVSDGPFIFDYRWLTPNATEEITKPWALKPFKGAFGVSFDDFELV